MGIHWRILSLKIFFVSFCSLTQSFHLLLRALKELSYVNFKCITKLQWNVNHKTSKDIAGFEFRSCWDCYHFNTSCTYFEKYLKRQKLILHYTNIGLCPNSCAQNQWLTFLASVSSWSRRSTTRDKVSETFLLLS